ncbi:MAG: OprO/OprP family phosphate-selective porin [Muribaculaceae bacterium]|nr:OprO/OprP family phosphate-selective porin [Muribaculaceae bacterium]
MTKRLLSLAVGAACVLFAAAADTKDGAESTSDLKKYIPEVHGNVRAFFEQSTVTGDSRFFVQHARVTAAGYATDWLDYFAQVDLCASGTLKILDVYATVKPVSGLKLMFGQSKAPFSTETARAPYTYLFANTAATFTPGNIRSVGLRVSYKLPKAPVTFEGGIYNNSDMSNHNTWNASLLYSLRASATFACGLRPSLGFMSRRPQGQLGVRVNQYDATLGWKHGRFFAEAEYLYRMYTGRAHKPTQAFSLVLDYGFRLKARMADKISVQGRFDGMGDYSNGIKGADGTLSNTSESFRRVTLGVTASRKISRVECNFLINFEQYFYGHGCANPPAAANNMLIAGINVRI